MIDCNGEDVQASARFWAEALGRPVEQEHPFDDSYRPLTRARNHSAASRLAKVEVRR